MKNVITQFIENRPDLQKLIEKFSSNKQSEKNDFIEDIEKEKIISKNLDFFLEHGYLFKLPIQIVTRILNSPDRILNNHHLLFNFIKKMISESNEQKSKDSYNEIKENLEIMICALDCNEMTNDEILELLEISKSCCHFQLLNTNAKIKSVLEMDKEKDIKISKLEEYVNNQNNEIKQLNQRIELIEKKIEEKDANHENSTKQLHQRIESIEKQSGEEVDIQKNEIKQFNQRIELIEKKIEEQSKLITQYQQELSKFAPHQNIEELNSKYGIIESNQKKIEDKIEQLEQINKNSQTSFSLKNCTEGVIRYLTESCGGNVADKGIVKLTASSLYSCDTYPLKSVVDIDEKKTSFVSENKPNSWIKYDFIDKKIHPTHYLIRSAHDNSKGLNNMRSWVCEGSNTDEENDWKILDSRNDVSYIDDAGAFHKFEIQTSLQQNECYRYLRIRQTKPNASKGNYLVISALEYYGSIIS